MNWLQRLIAKIGMDKIAHFFVSAFLVLALGRFVHPAIAGAVALLAGLTKELLDTPFNKKDLLADALGTALGVLILLL